MNKYSLFLIVTATVFAADVDSLIANLSTPKDVVTQAEIAALKDPFEKPQSAEKNDTNRTIFKPTLKLEAIFDGNALINGKWLKIGNTIHGYKLTQISRFSVVIESKQTKKTLHLFKGIK